MAVTNPRMSLMQVPNFSNQLTAAILAAGFFLLSSLFNPLYAAVLPEDRADIMYHRYDGGGMVIDGPSVLVRKNIADKISLAGNYYIDSVSSASIDVETSGATEYTEERKEYSFDASYLKDKSLINIGYTSSKENDYDASSFRIDFSQDFFGDMTTVSMGYSQGNDDITQTGNKDFSEELERRHYRIGIAQVLSRNLIANVNYESIIDEGYLQNPYRFILIDRITAYDLDEERYPNTRNSDAVSFKLSYHLPWSAAVKSRLGYFTDSWGIDGASIEFDYSHKLKNRLLLDLRLRYYQQSDADFYANAFDVNTALQTFVGRDKELSQYQTYSIGLGASYQWDFRKIIDKVRINAQIDYMLFDYENFREVTTATTASYGIGNEPFYNFNAYALRLFFSVWY